MLKKIILILFTALCLMLPASADNDILAQKEIISEARTLTFDEADTIDKIRSVNYFDREVGAGSLTVDTNGYDGQCAKFVTGASGNISMNIWDSYSGVIVFEGRFKFDDTKTTHKLLHINATDSTGTARWISGFNTKKSWWKFKLECSQGGSEKEITTGVWYLLQEVIDTENNMAYYYVDGTLLGSGALSYDVTATKRAMIQANSSTSASTMYFDSYKVSVCSGSVFDSITREPALSSRPDTERVKSDFKLSGTHPRIMATEEDFAQLKNELAANADKKLWYDWLIRCADDMLDAATLKYELRDGVRLMAVSSEMEVRMITLGMAYQLTGDTKYSDKAYTDLAAVAAFSDWHPSHHIDVGIMAAGYAVGYDWMYQAFTPEQRKVLEDGAKKNGFDDILQSYVTKSSEMGNAAYIQNNHNAMCNGGAAMLALAFYDSYPAESRYIISNAVRGFEEMLANYPESGSWYEGTTYGAVNINYLSMAFSSMEKCLGTIYELDTKTPGLKNAYSYIRNMESSVGNFNFADADFTEQVQCSGWFAKHFGGDTACCIIKNGAVTADGERIALALLWNSAEGKYDAPQDKFYEKDQLLLLRDGTGTFAGIKAGDTVYDHSHFDSGSFVFDSQGVRWACDLGKDDYNLDGYWDYKGDRWKIFRMRAESHNTVIVNPDMNPDYKIGSSAELSSFESNEKGAIAKIDMSDLLSERVNSASRAFCLTDGRKSLVIRDELAADEASDIYWLMYTAAEAQIDGSRVILTDKAQPWKKLTVDFLCNNDFEIIYEAAKPLEGTPVVDGQDENDGYYRLALKTRAAGSVNITVKLTPIDVVGSDVSDYDKSISEWELSDAVPADTLGYISAEDNELIRKEWQNITFDENADISNPNTSLINTRKAYTAKTDVSFEWSMNSDGASDVATVEEEADGNRVLRLSAKADSVYDKFDGVSVMFTDMTQSKTGGFTDGIIKYSADIKFPDFNSKKLPLACRYANDSGKDGMWLYSFGVKPMGDGGAVYITDNSKQYYYGVKKDMWYNFAVYVDIDNDKVSYYIDGTLIYETTAADGIANLQRAQLKVDGVSNDKSEMLADNIKVQKIEGRENELYCYAGTGTARTAASGAGDLIIAMYGENNELISAEFDTLSDRIELFECKLPKNTRNTAFMLWSSVGKMVPLRKSVKTNS